MSGVRVPGLAGAISIELKLPGGEVPRRRRMMHADRSRHGEHIDVFDHKAAVDDLVNHHASRLAHGTAADNTIQKGGPAT